MKLEKPGPQWWLGIVVGLVCMAATLVLWQGLKLDEHAHVQRMTGLAAKAVEADLRDDIQSRILSEILLARLWDDVGPSHEEWVSNALLYMKHHPDCIAVEWVDPTYHVRWVVPEKPNAGEMGLDLTSQEPVRQALERALNAHDDPAVLTKALRLPDGRLVRRVAVAIYDGDQFFGFVVAVFDVQRSFETMLADHAGLGYTLSVTEEGKELYRLSADSNEQEKEWAEDVAVSFPGVTWNLRVWPKAALVQELKSRLPEVALMVGGALCLLFVLTVHLAQTARLKSQHVAMANLKLKNEIVERERAEQASHASEARLAGILEMSPDAIISVDEKQQVTLFNQGAEKTFGYKAGEVIGRDLSMLIPEGLRQLHHRHFEDFAASEQMTMRMCQRRNVLGVAKDGREFPMEASLSKLELNGEKIFTAILRDITERIEAEDQLRHAHDELEVRVFERTAELADAISALQGEVCERKQAEASLRELSTRLLQLQDEERRRIARELHDSTAQNLAALAMNVAILQQAAGTDERSQEVLQESTQLVEQCSNEIRTISYLLHPPLLDDLGLDSALRWYVSGFSSRSGIQVSLQVQPDVGRYSQEVELTLFRIVQEALTNIHRHSRSQTARLRLSRDQDNLTLEIADQGRGMPEAVVRPETASVANLGVGIAGMRERVRQLGGQLQIRSGSEGTTITTVLPVGEHVKPADTAVRDFADVVRTRATTG